MKMENFDRSQTSTIDSNRNFDVQLVEYHEQDNVNFSNGEGHSYEIFIFGVLLDNRSIAIKVENFKPYFFVEVPSKWNAVNDTESFKEWLNEQEYTNRSGQDKSFKYPLKDSEFSIEKKIKFDGFQNNKKTNFLKIEFKSLFGFHTVKRFFMDNKEKEFNGGASFPSFTPKLFESNLQPLLRFFHEKNIDTCGWITLQRNKFESIEVGDERFSNCQVECKVDWNDIIPVKKDSIGPLIIAGFDLECTSGDGSFPQFNRPEDKIIQIGTTIERYSGKKEKEYINHIVTLDTCDPIEGAIVVSCETEAELIKTWINLILQCDPDIITGYNINGFDFDYLYGRAKMFKVTEIDKFSRLKNFTNKLEIKKLESGALGENYLKYINLVGRINFDLLPFVRREHKMDSYRLDSVAEKFMGMNKHDVSPNMIFKLQKGSSADRKIIAEYCIQDCRLCNELLIKLCGIENTFGMASTCYIPNNFIHFRGQGIKGFSLVAKECRELGYIIPVLKQLEDSNYTGATVLTANSGFHPRPVSCLDFASLYPSCMLSHNLCISSIVTDDKLKNLPGKQYKTIAWTDKKTGEEKSIVYVQPENEDNRAVLPKIISKLLKKRRETRNLMKTEKDPFKNSVLNGFQLSYKITANSIYGLLGASTSAISRPEVAESITTTGRAMLELASNFVLKNYHNSSIIYGDTDSIFISFELKNHNENCLFHTCNISARISQFHQIKDSIVEQMKISNESFSHCPEATAMMLKTDFKIYNEECKCPLFENMSKGALAESIKLAQEAQKIIGSILPKPHVLEYEKTYHPFLLFTKKRYIGYLYETSTDDSKRKLDYKGIALKRRDSAKIVKTVYKGCIDQLLSGSEERAVDFLKTTLNKIINDEYNIDEFILSKTLKSINSYKIRLNKTPVSIPEAKKSIMEKVQRIFKNKPMNQNTFVEFLNNEDISGNEIMNTSSMKESSIFDKDFFTQFEILLQKDLSSKISQGHVVLNERIRTEDAGQAYEINERIPYCFFTSTKKDNSKTKKKQKQCDIIETPERIKAKKLKIDYLYYIQNQLRTPISQLFEHMQSAGICQKLFDNVETECDRKNKGIKNLSLLFGMNENTSVGIASRNKKKRKN